MPPASNAFYIESTHDTLIEHTVVFCGIADGGFLYRDDVMVAAAAPSGLAETSCTSFRTDSSNEADTYIERSDELFGARGLKYSILLRDELDEDIDEAADRRGMRRMSKSMPRMIVYRRVGPPVDATVAVVETEAGVREWVDVIGGAFGFDYPTEALRNDLSPPGRILANPAIRLLLASIDGIAVAGGMLYRHKDLAYISNVGTIVHFRNRGVASSLVRYATNLGFDLGATATFLFASHGASHIWEHVGFETISFIHHRVSN